jgi:hypothetical protein
VGRQYFALSAAQRGEAGGPAWQWYSQIGMKPAIFGEPVTAIDVERLPADNGAIAFVRLCGSLIGAALAERAGSFTLPEISERINVPDGGVDACYTAPPSLEISETGGLVGPGTTNYQFKYRDPTAAPRSLLLRRLVRRLRQELARTPPGGDRYVLVTNLDLSGGERRRLREALIDAHPPLASRVMVVWGATEIALALNATPRLRHLFFSGSRLCTLDTAKSELRAVYESVGWPAFVGREAERQVIERFAEDSGGARYLEVVGARYSGRTRLVIEALEARSVRVVWASEPEAAAPEVFRELDADDPATVLVVDGCTPRALRDIRDHALSRQRLKTLAISTGGEGDVWWAESGRVAVDRLQYGDAAKLVGSVLPRAAPLQESWVIEAAGGLPGLILHVAALLRERAVSPASDPEAVQHRLGRLLIEQYTSGLSPEAREGLTAVSILSVVGVEGDVSDELEAVSRALGVDARAFHRARDELEDQGIVRRRGRFVEVVPPRLAEELASRALRNPETIVAELRLRLTDPAFLRFLERLRALPGDISQRVARAILGPGGWFPDFDSLKDSASRFESLVATAPGDALRCLERVLQPLSTEELRTRVTGNLRRSVVCALDDLALGSSTFEGAARLLLALAEAENEEWGNNAREVFGVLFHWNHPEVAAALPVRQAVLDEEANSERAARRTIVAKACGAAFGRHSIILHHAKGAAVPEGPGVPATWADVHRYGEGVLAILERLLVDPDLAVSDEAVTSLLQVTEPFVRLSLLPDALHPLGRKALDTVEGVGRKAASARQRSRVVSQLELMAENLRERADAISQDTVAMALHHVRSLIEALTTRTLKDRLWRWIGPRTWEQETAARGEDSSHEEIEMLARELVATPKAFLDELPWLTSEDAEHRWTLFRALGRVDLGASLFEALLDRPGDQFWAPALAAYLQGWHGAEPQQAESALDNLIGSRPDLSAGALAATLSLSISPLTVRRVQRIAELARIPRSELAHQVASGLAWDQLSPSDAETLLASIDDDTAETRSALRNAIRFRLLRGAEMNAGLEAMGWELLDRDLPTGEDRGRDPGWDTLAAALGERDSRRLLGLFTRVVQESLAREGRRFEVPGGLPRTWRMLRQKERHAILRTLLDLRLIADPPHWLDWTLSGEVRPEEDSPFLLAFAEEKGVEGARIVARVVDPRKPGFWRLARALLAGWGHDNRLAARLRGQVLTGAWSGSPLPMIADRIRCARELTADTDPRVVRWAQALVTDLEQWRETATRQDREDWIWDQPIKRAELDGMLACKGSPERMWAIARLLADAPESRVRELLTPDDILAALPRLEYLDERTRHKWEAWARHWSRAD